MSLDSALPHTRRSQMTCINWSCAITCAFVVNLGCISGPHTNEIASFQLACNELKLDSVDLEGRSAAKKALVAGPLAQLVRASC